MTKRVTTVPSYLSFKYDAGGGNLYVVGGSGNVLTVDDATAAAMVTAGAAVGVTVNSVDTTAPVQPAAYDFVTQAELDAATLSPTLLNPGMETIPRMSASAAANTGTGSLRLGITTARRSETVATARMVSGTAAAATPTLVRIGLWLESVNKTQWDLVASTPNDTTLLSAAGTVYTKALSAQVALIKGRRYAVGLLVVTAAAAPTVVGIAGTAALLGTTPQLASLQAGQADLPNVITAAAMSGSPSGHLPYIDLT